MGFGSKKDKPTKEERILDTKISLEQLKDKYEKLMIMQRRILKGKPTPREKEMAEAKIRSALCAYTICSQASADLDMITSDMELNKSLRELNRDLRFVNRLAWRQSISRPITKATLNWRAERLQKREDKIKPSEIFNEDTQAAVDNWLGSKWESVADKYISGCDLRECLDETRILLESDPVPAFQDDIFGDPEKQEDVDDSSLRDLLNSDIF